MGLHTGEPTVTDEGCVGIDVPSRGPDHRGRSRRSDSSGNARPRRRGSPARPRRAPAQDLATPERLYQLGDGQFPPLRSLDQTNLPVQPTPFIGRERKLAEVLALLDVHLIVTLTGAGRLRQDSPGAAGCR